MSRPDAAVALMSLGFISDRDFVCKGVDSTQTTITWFSAQPQPSEATLNAVTAQQIIDWERNQLREEAKATFDQSASQAKLLMGIVGLLIQETNTLRSELNRLRSDVRSQVPTVPARTPLPAQTLADGRTALRVILDTL